ncbi:hypothetical protein [Sphingomonas sp. Ag1]|jgi:hypothetical protein|uniref:hypothetical protein n=1 Tax=Sphingomonas sp. Ag1 TaxID=1642949 RepID=UPI0006220563|nr:hypothetical protein [Sphingomonas sp. Ag1]KKI17913.1 hypothetical protein XM50_17015 [Sphingomonas sp. Ag1]
MAFLRRLNTQVPARQSLLKAARYLFQHRCFTDIQEHGSARKLGEPVFVVPPIQLLVDTWCRLKVGFRRLLPITGQSAVGPKPAGLVEQYLPFNKAPAYRPYSLIWSDPETCRSFICLSGSGND